MTNWTAGYVADIDYTFGYYAELNPLRNELAFLSAGVELPEIKNACELGFGQGVSVNLHAAGQPSTNWFGTDFNPNQAGFAQSIAKSSGVTAQLFDQSFEQFCGRADLPDFDFIGIHGIWSWISDANRSVIVDFIHRKLSVGGVVYISYNTLPGWSTAAPLRHVMTQYTDSLTGPGQGILNRIDAALDFTQQLVDSNPNYVIANPAIKERFKRIKEQNKNYLAHEYFNRDWHPMYFSDLSQWLKPAKVSFACSASFLDHIDAANLSDEQQSLLASLPDPNFKQTVRDFMVNQQFRKDLWVKGQRRIDPITQKSRLRAHSIILTTQRSNIVLEIQSARGQVNLNETIYNPIIDALSDHDVHTIGDLEKSLQNQGISLTQIVQAVIVLAAAGHVYSVLGDGKTSLGIETCQKANQEFINRSKTSSDFNYLASPLLGGGFPVTRFQQLFLLAMSHGKCSAVEWAQFAWEILANQNQRIIKDGKPLDTAEENLAELQRLALLFEQTQLPILKALLIA